MDNIYYYIYYKLYRLAESTSLPWWSDFKAGFLITIIQIIFLALLEYKLTLILFNGSNDFYGMWGYILLIGVPPLILNYFLFGYREKWKEIIIHFEKGDKQLKKKMNIQMTVVIIVLINIFIILFSL